MCNNESPKSDNQKSVKTALGERDSFLKQDQRDSFLTHKQNEKVSDSDVAQALSVLERAKNSEGGRSIVFEALQRLAN